MIYKKYIFGYSDEQMYFPDVSDLYPQFLKTVRATKVNRGFVIKGEFGLYSRAELAVRRANPMVRGVELSVPPHPHLQAGEGPGE